MKAIMERKPIRTHKDLDVYPLARIWPKGDVLPIPLSPYLPKLLPGRYDIDGMSVIVSRGVGTWGPRMRLWHRGEILRIRLRSP